MDDLVVAVFDIETANSPPGVDWDPERILFACGVIEWIHLRRGKGRQIERLTPVRKGRHPGLAVNVYWNPRHMVQDLFLPWSHVICGFNAASFDIPVLCGKWEDGPGVEKKLRAKLFDPFDWLCEQADHPTVAKLSYLREGLEMDPWTYDGREIPHAELPGMWRAGFMWPVIDACRHDVEVLREVVHVGVHGRLNANRLNETMGGEPRGDVQQWRSHEERAQFKYHIDTREWWGLLVDIATRVREQQKQELEGNA